MRLFNIQYPNVLVVGDLNSPHTQNRIRLISEFANVFIINCGARDDYPDCHHYFVPASFPRILRVLYSVLIICWFVVSRKGGWIHALGAFHGFLTPFLTLSNRLIVTCMGSDILVYKGRRYEIFTTYLLRNADVVTVKSSNLRDKVLSLGVDSRIVFNLMWELKLNTPEYVQSIKSPFVITSHRGCRQIYQNKLIVEGFHHFIMKFGRDVRLRILEGVSGENEEIERIKNYIKSLGLEDEILLLSKMTHQEMMSVYQSSSVLISYPVTDGYPQSLLESALISRWHIVPNFKQYSDIDLPNIIKIKAFGPEAIADAFEEVLKMEDPKQFSIEDFNKNQRRLLQSIYLLIKD